MHPTHPDCPRGELMLASAASLSLLTRCQIITATLAAPVLTTPHRRDHTSPRTSKDDERLDRSQQCRPGFSASPEETKAGNEGMLCCGMPVGRLT